MTLKPLQIDLEIYEISLIFCSTRESLLEFCSKNKINMETLIQDPKCAGFSSILDKFDGSSSFVLVFVDSQYKPDDAPFTLSILAHELHHAVNIVFEAIGEEDKSFESKAYLMSYLYRKCVKDLLKHGGLNVDRVSNKATSTEIDSTRRH